MENYPDEVVHNGRTLKEVCAKAGLTLENLSLDRSAEIRNMIHFEILKTASH
jgi:hypothetical protein